MDNRILSILDDMAETMYQVNGAGLAAVQVGILRDYQALYHSKESG
jgi:peptide deformylase